VTHEKPGTALLRRTARGARTSAMQDETLRALRGGRAKPRLARFVAEH